MTTPTGTTPQGAAGERQAAEWVRRMFGEIAPKYDLLNHLLSFNVDRGWRKALIKSLAGVLSRPDGAVLDLCCGTGDVLLDLQRCATTTVMGADFCHPMLVAAHVKARRQGFEAPLFEADALQLPLASASLDAISIAFGFRNLANYEAGLLEFWRVLKPGGTLAILEFSHPRGLMVRTAYGLYSKRLLPLIGRLISGSSEAYSYLPDSIEKFPNTGQLGAMMTNAGFKTRFELLTGGIAALHVGRKSPPG